jgi:hypothetical protein
LTTDENQPAAGALDADDPDGDALTYSIVTNGALGTATITDANAGSYTYTPNPNVNGIDTFTFKVNDGTEDSNTATVTVTINSVNTPPTADAGPDQAVDELVLVVLDGSGSDDIEDGAGNLSYAWAQTGGPPVQLIDADTDAPSFTAPAVAASTALAFELEVTDTGTLTDTDQVTVTVENAANLSGVDNDSPYSVDLAAEGTIDWIHWGLNADVTIFNQKAGAAERIGDYFDVGTVTAERIADDSPVGMSWTGGESGPGQQAIANDVQTGLFYAFPANTLTGDGIELRVNAADTNEKTLKVYVGGFRVKAKFTATLPGVAPYEVIVDNPATASIVKVITLTFGAAQAGDELNIKYTIEDSPQSGAITLHAAALSEAKVATPEITPPNGTYAGSTDVTLFTATPNAVIRYTLDDTEPDENSTLYTGSFTRTSDTIVRAKAFLSGYTPSNEARADLTIPSAGNTILAAFVDDSPYSVDLAAEGTIDWIHWGLNADVTIFNQKAGAAERIGDYFDVGTVTAERIADDSPVGMSWTGGESGPGQQANANDVQTGLFYAFPANTLTGDGIELRVIAADTNEKTLKVYVGGFRVKAKFTATLPGAAPYEVIVDSPATASIVKVITLTFGAAQAGDELNIKYTVEDSPQSGAITLHAGTLSN